MNRSFYSGSTEELGSLGYTVVDTLGHTYFITAAHLPNGFHGANGAIGDTVWQGPRDLWGTAMGRITVNPPWNTVNCGMGANYCPRADVAAGVYFAGQTSTRKVGTSMYEGVNGSPSRDGTINGGGPYPVTEAVTPEWVDTTFNYVAKSGFATGTTSGQIDVPSGPALLTYTWGVNGGLGPVTAFFPNAIHVAHIGFGGGDSGGPVWAGNRSPYRALGILVGGTGHENGVAVCDAGVDCGIILNRWTDIEAQLGLGRLNPATTPAPAIAVTIAGTTRMTSGLWCSFTASATGGSGTYSFSWQFIAVNGASADGYVFTNNTYRLNAQSNSGTVYLTATATDAGGKTGSITKPIMLGSGSCAG
jgi:hypothetical protein